MAHTILMYCVSLLSICNCNNTSTNKTTINSIETSVEKEHLISSQLKFSDSLKCSIIIVRKTDNKIEKLTSLDLKMFLCTFSKECSRNIEYTEHSNEVLFRVLEYYPSQFMDCINSNPDIEFEYILSELANPLLDINGKKLIKRIENAKGEPCVKLRIIESIEKAME